MKALVLFFTVISFYAKAQLVEMQDGEWNRYKYEAIDTVGTFVELSFDKNSAIAKKNAHQFRLHKHKVNESDITFKSTSSDIYTCAVEVDPTNELFDIISLNTNVVSAVKLKKNALNRFVITYDGSLVFTYRDNRKRPVLLTAYVEKREFHKKSKQEFFQNVKCSEHTLLIPGDYTVSLDVLPPYIVVTQVSFGRTTEIQLPQLGAVYLSAIVRSSPMKLYVEQGNKYELVQSFDYKKHCLNGRINLRPGAYKIIVDLDPGTKQVIYFAIKSNLITYILNYTSTEKTPFLPTAKNFLYKP